MPDYPPDIMEKAREAYERLCWHSLTDEDEIAAIAAAILAERERWLDKVDGLESDLSSAVEVAWNRGAHEWVRLNYPKQYERLAKRPPTPS